MALALFVMPARAADDIQLFKLGPHTFYVPKVWMEHGSFVAYAPAGTPVTKPQSGPITALVLTIRPRHLPDKLGALTPHDLPDFIQMNYGAAPDHNLRDMYQHDVDVANSLAADATGFVRVETGFAKPGEPPQWERYLYKGYRNELGEPLLVNSSNDALYPSTVSINLRTDVRLMYRFDIKGFPRNTWWDLYRNVVAFLSYLQMPK